MNHLGFLRKVSFLFAIAGFAATVPAQAREKEIPAFGFSCIGYDHRLTGMEQLVPDTIEKMSQRLVRFSSEFREMKEGETFWISKQTMHVDPVTGKGEVDLYEGIKAQAKRMEGRIVVQFLRTVLDVAQNRIIELSHQGIAFTPWKKRVLKRWPEIAPVKPSAELVTHDEGKLYPESPELNCIIYVKTKLVPAGGASVRN